MRLVSSTAWRGSPAIRWAQASACSRTSLVGAHVIDQPDLGGPPGRDAVAGQRVLLGQLEAGQQRPGHRATVGRDQADHHVGVGQVGALGHVDDVRQGHQAAAQPDRGSVDGGDDRDPAPHHAGHDLPAVGERLLRSPASRASSSR